MSSYALVGDFTAQEYVDVVEKLVNDQCKIGGAPEAAEKLHPEVQRLLGKLELNRSRFGSLYEVYGCFDGGQGWKRKRSETEEATLEEYQRKHPRIDLAKYDIESENLEVLGTIDSYLKHQSLVLEKCMAETILSQWAINNDYVEKATENLQDRITKEKALLKNLDQYREMLQRKNKPVFARLRREWKQQLVKNATGGNHA